MQTDARVKGVLSLLHIALVFLLAYGSFKTGQLFAAHQLTQDAIEAAGSTK